MQSPSKRSRETFPAISAGQKVRIVNLIQKDEAAFSASAAENALYDVQVLRDAAERIQNSHNCTEPGDCDNAEQQIRVLADVAEEKLEIAFDNLMIVTQYFEQTAAGAVPEIHPDRQDSTATAVFTAIRNVSQN